MAAVADYTPKHSIIHKWLFISNTQRSNGECSCVSISIFSTSVCCLGMNESEADDLICCTWKNKRRLQKVFVSHLPLHQLMVGKSAYSNRVSCDCQAKSSAFSIGPCFLLIMTVDTEIRIQFIFIWTNEVYETAVGMLIEFSICWQGNFLLILWQSSPPPLQCAV